MSENTPITILKTVLIKDTQAELAALDKMLNDGWDIASGWNHPQGTLMVLRKITSEKIEAANET